MQKFLFVYLIKKSFKPLKTHYFASVVHIRNIYKKYIYLKKLRISHFDHFGSSSVKLRSKLPEKKKKKRKIERHGTNGRNRSLARDRCTSAKQLAGRVFSRRITGIETGGDRISFVFGR